MCIPSQEVRHSRAHWPTPREGNVYNLCLLCFVVFSASTKTTLPRGGLRRLHPAMGRNRELRPEERLRSLSRDPVRMVRADTRRGTEAPNQHIPHEPRARHSRSVPIRATSLQQRPYPHTDPLGRLRRRPHRSLRRPLAVIPSPSSEHCNTTTNLKQRIVAFGDTSARPTD